MMAYSRLRDVFVILLNVQNFDLCFSQNKLYCNNEIASVIPLCTGT
jgi:hypothetical protein